MVDTVVLTLSCDMFKIINPDKFKPSARWILENNSSLIAGLYSKQNPSKKELIKGVYKPRLTLANHVNFVSLKIITLRIELFLPKLLFGNNFDELKAKIFH